MPSTVKELARKQLIQAPGHVTEGVQYEVIMGSFAYGVSSDTSDIDLYGFCIPSKDMIFPHLRGEIEGFGKQKQRFEQYQQQHIIDSDKKEYDISVYSIVKYFHLVMGNNPNMIDSLFVPQRCIVFSTPIGGTVRENRRMFLHKGAWHTFKGYAYSQLSKMQTKNPEGKRKAEIEKYGYDPKYAYHLVRLLNEVEQILIEGDIDLERNREQLKSIRRGEWSIKSLKDYFDTKEKELESVYLKSSLPHSPDEKAIKNLLLDCLEQHFGSLDACIVREDELKSALLKIEEITSALRAKGAL